MIYLSKVYNIKDKQGMDIEGQAQEDNSQDNNSKFNSTYGNIKKFNIELTGSQANAIDKILPRGYSMQI